MNATIAPIFFPRTPSIKPRLDANGKLSFWFVLPTHSLRELVETKLLDLFPNLNYGVKWKDVKGFGLHMTIAAYKPADRAHYYCQ